MSDKNASSVGRDELAALLGASRASDLVAAANNDANNNSSLSAGLAPQSRRLNRKEDAEDVSKMDRAQAAALVAKKFGSGTQSSSAAAGGVSRHRASGKRKRQYQLLAGDLTESNNAVISSMDVEEGIDDFYDKGGTRKEEEDTFTINKTASGGGKRKKLQAKVLLKRGGDGNGRTDRRCRSYSDSSSASSSSSSSQSQSSSSDDESTNRSSRRNRRRRSNSSSASSSDEDEADLRRKRARAKAQRNQSEAVVVSVRDRKEDSTKNDSSQSLDKLDARDKSINTNGNTIPKQKKIDDEKITNAKQNKWEGSLTKKKKQNSASSRSDSSSSDDNDDSSTSSSSSSSSEDESEDDIAPISVSKPLFVPKSKRGTVAEVEAQQRKIEEAEERRIQYKEKRAVQSRALVAEAVSAVGKNGASSGIDDGDEFDTGEVGGEFIPVPDDSDPVDEDSPELVLAERDAWEARELIRILRDVDEAAKLEKERKELERRRALTDDERLEEDRRSGRYRAPGEARRGRKDDERRVGSKSDINYLQRYHHRGAFYLDDDTLNEAGANDVRHRALEYSRSATGDRIDKRSLPEVMQVKNFGLAGYSTKYKGLSKEDTTDKRLDFLPIRGASAGKKDEKGGNNRYNQR